MEQQIISSVKSEEHDAQADEKAPLWCYDFGKSGENGAMLLS